MTLVEHVERGMPGGPPFVALIVHHRPDILHVVGQALREGGFEVREPEGSEAIESVGGGADLLLIDRDLPGVDIVERLSEFRVRLSDLSTIVLSGRNDLRDCARVLDAGADDYLPENAHPDELIARARAVLRWRSASRPLVLIGPLEIDLEERMLRRNGELVTLSRTEWLVLERLAMRVGHGVPVEELLRAARGFDAMVGDPRHVRAWIARLRRKLGVPAGQPGSIRHLRWAGYVLDTGDGPDGEADELDAEECAVAVQRPVTTQAPAAAR